MDIINDCSKRVTDGEGKVIGYVVKTGSNPSFAELERREEALELALICAQDIVDAWPTLTMRTLGNMTKRIDTLRQALEASKIRE